MFEQWSDIGEYREKKGIRLEQLSEKMRIPVEKILFLEAGNFTHADPVITRLHLKNYALQVGLDYAELLAMSGLEKKEERELPESILVQSAVKKTRSYRGRKKEPSKVLIYSLVIAAVIAFLFLLNMLSRHFNVSSNLYEMTEMQRKALDENKTTGSDSQLFRPVLPQSAKKAGEKDIYQDMEMIAEFDTRFPLQIKIFPRNNISYRHEIPGEMPLEDMIMKYNPRVLSFTKPGKMIFSNTLDSRFVIADMIFRDKEYSTLLVDINAAGTVRLFTRSVSRQ
jgi:transcriptional regulator with XRE-family HTH domain